MTQHFDPDYIWYNYYSYYLKNPIKLIKAPIGRVLGKIIVQHQSFDESKDIIVSKNGFKTNCYINRHNNDQEQDNGKRKISILFAGNGNNWTPEEVEPKIRRGRDIATVYHPIGAASAEAEIECGETLIKKLISDGYKPENIEIMGYSLGGGISAQVLNRFRFNGVLKEGEAFESYVNHKSFSYLSYAATFMIFAKPFYGYSSGNGGDYNIKNYKVIKFVSTVISKTLDFFGWETPTEEVLQKRDLPVKKIIILTDQNDEVLGNLSAIKADSFKHKDEFNFVPSLTGGHGALNGLYEGTQKQCNVQNKISKMSLSEKTWETSQNLFSINNFLNLALLYIGGTMLSRLFIGKPLYNVIESSIKSMEITNYAAKVGHVAKYCAEQVTSKLYR